jgi:hypothetical protein
VQYEHTVGIPRGLFSLVPSLGIHTLGVGLDLPVIINLFTRLKRATGDSDLIASTQKRFFTRVLLSHLAYGNAFC